MNLLDRITYKLMSGLRGKEWRQFVRFAGTVELNRALLDSALSTALSRGKPCRSDSIVQTKVRSKLYDLTISFPASKGYLTGELKIEVYCKGSDKLFNTIARMLKDSGALVEQNVRPYYKCTMSGKISNQYHLRFYDFF